MSRISEKRSCGYVSGNSPSIFEQDPRSLFFPVWRYRRSPDSERHSFIFDAKSSTGPSILKVTHPSHRTYEHLEAEVAWLNYLVANGVRAPRNRRSINSQFVERVPAADIYFSVVSYEKLGGEIIEDALLTETLFRPWGKLIGQLHRLSSGYLSKAQRYAWYESDFLDVERYIPTDHGIRNHAQRIIQDIKELPSSQFQYGLIHADVYQENMFSADGELPLRGRNRMPSDPLIRALIG